MVSPLLSADNDAELKRKRAERFGSVATEGAGAAAATTEGGAESATAVPAAKRARTGGVESRLDLALDDPAFNVRRLFVE